MLHSETLTLLTTQEKHLGPMSMTLFALLLNDFKSSISTTDIL